MYFNSYNDRRARFRGIKGDGIKPITNTYMWQIDFTEYNGSILKENISSSVAPIISETQPVAVGIICNTVDTYLSRINREEAELANFFEDEKIFLDLKITIYSLRNKDKISSKTYDSLILFMSDYNDLESRECMNPTWWSSDAIEKKVRTSIAQQVWDDKKMQDIIENSCGILGVVNSDGIIDEVKEITSVYREDPNNKLLVHYARRPDGTIPKR